MRAPQVLLLAGLTVANAAHVYLHPAQAVPITDAAAALAHHFGLEAFEPAPSAPPAQLALGNFVGEGLKDGLLLAIDEADEEDILQDLPVGTHLSDPRTLSAPALLNTYRQRAPALYPSVASTPASAPAPARLLDAFSAPSTSTDAFLSALGALVVFLEDPTSTPRFGALRLGSLAAVRAEHGPSSAQYTLAKETVRAALQSALAHEHLQLAIVTTTTGPSPAVKKRSARAQPTQAPLPMPPLGSSARCFASADACTNGTDACSGHGACARTTDLKGAACFVCQCGQTTSARGKVESWAGAQCERKDVSGPFVMLAGTAIALMLLIAGSVSILSSVGDEELPGTLVSTAGAPKRE